MSEPVLIQALGNSKNLRMLNFFIENPFDSYNISEIAEFSEITRNSVYSYLPEFLEKGYLIEEVIGKRKMYRLDRSNPVIKYIDGAMEDIGDYYVKSERTSSKPVGIVQKSPCKIQDGVISSFLKLYRKIPVFAVAAA